MPRFEDRVVPRKADTTEHRPTLVGKVAFADIATVKRMMREWSVIRPLMSHRLNGDLVEKLDTLNKHDNDAWVRKDIAETLSTAITNGLTATLLKSIEKNPRMTEQANADPVIDMRHDFNKNWALLRRIDSKQKPIKAQLTAEQKDQFDVAIDQAYSKLLQNQPAHILIHSFTNVARGIPVEEFEHITNTPSPQEQQKRALKLQAE